MIAVLPTLSAPIYETLHTGLEPLEHGITSNDNLRKSKFENIFTIAKAGGLVTAATAHSFFSTLYNEDPYIPIRDQEVNDPDKAIQHGRFYSENGYTAFNIALPSDHDLMNQASMLIDRYKPHYLMIHSSSCDSIGHKFGGNSSEYSKQAWQVNDQLAQHIPFWIDKGYRILITSDHGFTDVGSHGGSSQIERWTPYYDIGHPNPGIESKEVSQLSVAPSILSILGLSIPKKMNAPLIDK
jgi:predicted AlkP superfamily pyrophosphatase or phosphodiesterase